MSELGLWGIAGAPAWDESVLPMAWLSQVATWAKELERELRRRRRGREGGRPVERRPLFV